MAINWSQEAALFSILEVGNLLMSHFGYVAIAATAALFKLAVAATLAAYAAFLCATLVGGLATYFPVRFIGAGLEYFDIAHSNALMAIQLGLSPMVGAFLLNSALGWSLALMPMLAIGGVAAIAGLATLYVIQNGCSPKASSERVELMSNEPSLSFNNVPEWLDRRDRCEAETSPYSTSYGQNHTQFKAGREEETTSTAAAQVFGRSASH